MIHKYTYLKPTTATDLSKIFAEKTNEEIFAVWRRSDNDTAIKCYKELKHRNFEFMHIIESTNWYKRHILNKKIKYTNYYAFGFKRKNK